MQISLNIIKKSKIINYKDNIFLSKLNNLFFFQFIKYLLLFLHFFRSNKLTKLIILAFISNNFLFYFTDLFLATSFFFKNFIHIKQPVEIRVGYEKPRKTVYPVLKSPFIYKKAFRHFVYQEYIQKILYSGKVNYFMFFFNINLLKIEFTNSLKNLQIIENQTFRVY
jgi:hypothetical protein